MAFEFSLNAWKWSSRTPCTLARSGCTVGKLVRSRLQSPSLINFLQLKIAHINVEAKDRAQIRYP
jgi:hypothetical protein